MPGHNRVYRRFGAKYRSVRRIAEQSATDFLHTGGGIAAVRADRIVRLYGESDKSPEARLNEKDKRRRVNYQHYTGRTWGQSQNYDICLNSGVLGIDQCVDIIVGAVENSKK